MITTLVQHRRTISGYHVAMGSVQCTVYSVQPWVIDESPTAWASRMLWCIRSANTHIFTYPHINTYTITHIHTSNTTTHTVHWTVCIRRTHTHIHIYIHTYTHPHTHTYIDTGAMFANGLVIGMVIVNKIRLLSSSWWTMYTIHCTLYTVHYTLYYTVCTVHCTLYTIYCIEYNVQCTMHSIQCTVHCITYN